LEAGVEREKPAVDLPEAGAGPSCSYLCCESSLVLDTAAVGQGPAGASGELGPGHPAVRLEVDKVLLDDISVETEARRDLLCIGETQQPNPMKRQRAGVRSWR
jgi:hypothetical protein